MRKTPLIGKALGLVLMFAYRIMDVEKVEFSVYKENSDMLKLVGKYGIKKVSESQSEINSERTLINLEISKEQLQEIDEKLKRFYEKRIR